MLYLTNSVMHLDGFLVTSTIGQLDLLNLPKSSIKNLLISLHRSGIKYMLYFTLNKHKLDKVLSRLCDAPLPSSFPFPFFSWALSFS